MTVEELSRNIGNYVILNLIPSNPELYYADFRKIREIRRLEKVVEGVAWLGQGIIMNMPTKEVLAGCTSSDPMISMPAQEIYKAVGKDIGKLIEEHFANQEYFINGSIV
jgi:hypothetical protein